MFTQIYFHVYLEVIIMSFRVVDILVTNRRARRQKIPTQKTTKTLSPSLTQRRSCVGINSSWTGTQCTLKTVVHSCQAAINKRVIVIYYFKIQQ